MSDANPLDGAAPIIVSALFAPEEQAWFEGLRRTHFPPERNQLAAHLTLFHHLPPSCAGELARRLADAARAEAPLPARLAGVRNLGRGTALGIKCPRLAAIRADLAEAFGSTLTAQDRAGWRPHVTIQNKVPPEEARRLQADLTPALSPRPLTIVALAAWWYRGGPWEAIGRYAFRGPPGDRGR